MQLRLIDSKENNAFMNMAIDEALLASRLPVLRFYSWNPAALSIGYFQSIRDFNLDNLKKHNIDLVRRLTGGDAVLHDKELTYSFIIGESLMPESVTDSYKIISKGILLALKSLGIKAEMNEEVDKNKKTAICFNNPSWYELTVNNKKIVGSAQKRVDGKLLQHGAILLDIGIEKLASLFKTKTDINKLKNKITSINQESKNKITYDQLAEAMEEGFKKNLKAKLIKGTLADQEIKAAKKLAKEKYSTKEWNEKL